MNRYHESMEHCAPPPELEEQLREAVLSAEPEPQARTAVYRPRGFFRKALLAAVLAVVLTLSVGAAVLVDWMIFSPATLAPTRRKPPWRRRPSSQST